MSKPLAAETELTALDTEQIAEQFETEPQQKEAAVLGMWLFLATEVLFFGGLFLAYTVYRWAYPEATENAGRELNILIGTVNTGILLTSSMFMAFAARASEEKKKRATIIHLSITWVLGAAFMALKGVEYAEDFEKNLVPTASQIAQLAVSSQTPMMKMFYWIYYALTGLHALHLTIGLVVVATMIVRTLRSPKLEELKLRHSIEITALYWHFIDLVWIFLYPMLYLLGRNT